MSIQKKNLLQRVSLMQKIDPLIFSMPRNKYWSLGDQLGDAWRIDRELNKIRGKKNEG